MSLLESLASEHESLKGSFTSALHAHDNIHRALTYLDTDDQDIGGAENETVSDLGLVIAFSVLSAVFFLVMLVVIRINSTCHEFYEWNAIRLLMPTVACFLCIQTATLAAEAARTTVSHQWAIAVFLLSSTIAPGIFLVTFVITFLAYRTRSMPFCFVYRGPGRQATTGEPWRDDDEEVLQPLVRPAVLIVAIRLFALGLLILNLIVNFDVVWSEQDLAGRTGWVTVFQDPNNPAIDHVILALLPMALVSLCCLYFSLLLWRYGCEFSLVIYGAGVFNPWFAPVFGTVAMIAGQFFGPDLFLITSNSGILMFLLSMLRILFEERRDLAVSGELGKFLDALGNDNITRTQCGVEKSTPDDDTMSSGQHQQWMLNESNAEIISSPIKRQPSKASVAIEMNQMLPLHDQDDRMTSMTRTARQNSFASATSNSKRQISARTRSVAETGTTLESAAANASIKQPPPESAATLAKDSAPVDVENGTGSDPIVQRVQGVVKRPEKLRRGQRPKGMYIVQ
ncbi:MAG: hypothetical protein SGILL_008170 [Bacillariaceae sp.]